MEDLPLRDYQALSDLRWHIRRFLRFSEERAREAGIEPRQHQLMLAIKGEKGGAAPTIGTLATRLQLRHHTVVELVNRAEQHGLVRRERGERDRREVHVELTERGDALLRGLSIAHRTELRTMGPALIDVLQELCGRDGSEVPGAQGGIQ